MLRRAGVAEAVLPIPGPATITGRQENMPESSTIESRAATALPGGIPQSGAIRSSRFETWEQDLAAFLQEAAHKPFAWGAWDCCLFVSEAIRIMMGTDIAEVKHFRGNYHTRIGAYALLGKLAPGRNFRDAIDRLAEDFGLPLWKHPALAQRGDAVLVRDDQGTEALGIVDLDGCRAVALSEKGLVRLPADRILLAWKI